MAKPSKNRPGGARPENTDRSTDPRVDFGGGLGGFLGKLGGLVEKLGELAQAGEEFSHSGQIGGSDPQGRVRGVYGFSVKTGLGDHGRREFKVEPFGNIRRRPSGEAVVDELREPLVDVHAEDDCVLVVAEIPGVSKKDVDVALSGDRLTISAQHRQIRYRKEVVLPHEFSEDKMQWGCKNGVLSIRLER